MATALRADITFDSGKWGVIAMSQSTEASVTLCISATDHSKDSAYLTEVHLAVCGSSAGRTVLYDGSDGNALFGLPGCGSGGGGANLDMVCRGTDSLKTLGGDNTQTLCISAAGPWSIVLKGTWGPKGFTTV